MEKETFGNMVAALRKKKGMTQLELAEKMGVTDKAVSKWERDLSFPDVNTIPKLAEFFNVTVDELIQAKSKEKEITAKNKASNIASLALKGIALAMGISVAVLTFMNEIEAETAIQMLGIGLACMAVTQLPKKEE